MVDASVGGKTGVDFQGLKNQIGIINPELVLIDSIYLKLYLKTNIGVAFRKLKHGIISDAEFLKSFQNTNF